MQLINLLERVAQLREWGPHGATQQLDLGKIKVVATRNKTMDDETYTSYTDISTKVNSFRGHKYDSGTLLGFAKFNKTTKQWEVEFNGNLVMDDGIMATAGSGTGQTLELSARNAIRDYVERTTALFRE